VNGAAPVDHAWGAASSKIMSDAFSAIMMVVWRRAKAAVTHKLVVIMDRVGNDDRDFDCGDTPAAA
jgi:hypothetical protein